MDNCHFTNKLTPDIFYLCHMITFPNAKINLGLQVLRKRKDGFHDIETVFYPVPMCDSLEILPSEDSESAFHQYGISIGEGENLCQKACKLLKMKYPIRPVDMHLIKHIPSGAGLGGGSSDAAHTLMLLNEIFDLGIKESELEGLASTLGSDCPFFIRNTATLASGRGEVFNSIELDLAGSFIVIVKPDVNISTPEAYAMVRPQDNRPSLREIIHQPISRWKDRLINDFEAPVFHQYPALKTIKEYLYNNGALYASMSGSGSAIFGIFEKEVKLSSPGTIYSAYL
jgi:4-diphosphocytidyl-2-C-methyl-D-erythritol kinase